MDENNQSGSSESIFDYSEVDPTYYSSTDSSSNTENINDNDQAVKRKSRKRLRNQSTQNIIKRLKDSGHKYRMYRGKGPEVQQKRIGNPCTCKLKCFENMPADVRKSIFTKFWAYADYNIQNVYLSDCIRRSETKNDLLCKNALISVHGTGRSKLEKIVTKLREGQDGSLDGRARHEKHIKKYTREDIQNVNNFAELLPKYESHYRRNKSPNMEYSIQWVYDEYQRKCGLLQDEYVVRGLNTELSKRLEMETDELEPIENEWRELEIAIIESPNIWLGSTDVKKKEE
ncbi:hypothetical protein ILUMI_02702, partial [Ignelater luminosus]